MVMVEKSISSILYIKFEIPATTDADQANGSNQSYKNTCDIEPAGFEPEKR